jgi:hypothetical protein
MAKIPKILPLPPLMAGAIPAIRWPLDPSSSLPLSLESLERLSEIRAKAQKDVDAPALPIDAILCDIPGAITNLANAGDLDEGILDRTDRRHHCIVSIALVLLGNGFADEAHSLVTPLSWPNSLPHGYGEPVTASPSAAALASYVHSLVHRREAFHVGEFGQSGFKNSDFWVSNTFRYVWTGSLPLERIARDILDTANGNAAAEAWCRENSITNETASMGEWDPRALNKLISSVLNQDEDVAQLLSFAERAATVELRVLLRHTLEIVGYDIPECLVQSEESF